MPRSLHFLVVSSNLGAEEKEEEDGEEGSRRPQAAALGAGSSFATRCGRAGGMLTGPWVLEVSQSHPDVVLSTQLWALRPLPSCEVSVRKGCVSLRTRTASSSLQHCSTS